MVLINELTVEQINAALLHLQRSKDEVVGGEKGTTIQNITISNSGGGNNVDYSGTIKNLATNIEKNKTAIEKNASDIAKLKSDFSNIEKSVEDTLEGLVDNGISDLSFDPLTKQLTITTNDGDTFQTTITQDIGVLSYDSATNKLILTTGEQTQEITLPYIKSSEKGSANGVATLDENGRVPYSQLPESAMEFLGQWDASTNTPHLADGTGTNGDFYIVSAGGTVNLGTAQDPHIITFSVNDRIVYEGDIAQWVRLPAGQVSSVNGQSGEVTLTASDIEYSTGVSIKAKIDANAVQADWNVSDTTSLAYIKNKPTIPASPVQSDWNVTDTTSLAYIKNKPATNLVCTCKYTDAYNFDVVLTNTCDSQTQYTWVSATCRLRFCSSTGVLTSTTFCGMATRDRGGAWIKARENVVAKQTKLTKSCGGSYNPVVGVKTWAGHWSLGTVGGESLMFVYDTDANYNANNNEHTQINLPTAGAEGTLALLKCDTSGYWGMTDADGGDTNFIRTTGNGLIPKVGGAYNNGHGYLGTSTWYFGQGYISTIYAKDIYACCFCGTASCATHATCADHASSADVGELSWTSCGCGVCVSGQFVKLDVYQDYDCETYKKINCFVKVVTGKSRPNGDLFSVIGQYCCLNDNKYMQVETVMSCSNVAYIWEFASSCASISDCRTFCCTCTRIQCFTNLHLLAIR